MTQRAAAVPLALTGLAVLGAVWWAATAEGGVLAQRFAPQATLASLALLLQQPDFLLHLWVSLRRVLAGLGMALIVGVPVGLLVGAARSVDTALSPAFQFLRMISPLSWMPVVVMVFGVGDRSVLFLLAFAGVWPIVLNTAAGVRSLDARWLMLARSLAATPTEMLTRVIVPGVVGHALTGLRLAIGVVWIVLVPAEMLGVNAGLGYFILDTRDRLAYSELLATVIVIGAVGMLLDSAARRLLRWWRPG
ncbi:ABC transporter permease [Cupriavidus gilardii]|uniref:ABC transporter permease n=1 Tax=Cupriavidus gilardii TaxID=82541 RepID=UPI001571D73D|nr:ABC transporter permease [Cupriavidus gilardii]NSX03273.1 ABC transporter permease [Cupriavidus gilardii]